MAIPLFYCHAYCCAAVSNESNTANNTFNARRRPLLPHLRQRVPAA
jgi:hypothetical protein